MVEEGITNILRFYDYLLRRTDSRVRDNPLMQSPIQMTLILMVAFNAYIVYEVSWDICYTNVSTEKHSETWLFYYSKYIELLETKRHGYHNGDHDKCHLEEWVHSMPW
uniref:Uncharacterized protein n=1 Tax=Denticeps clupeoides TaxID=299321 RepID=A0AAY4C2R7_9TELE